MKKRVYTAADLNLSAVTTAAPRTSEAFDIHYADRFSVLVAYADGAGGTTKVTCALEFTEMTKAAIDGGGTPVWHRDQTQSTAAGVVTLAPMLIEQVVAATGADDSEQWCFEVLSTCYLAARLVFTFDNGHANDTISVKVVAANHN